MERRLRNDGLHSSCVDQVCESSGWRDGGFCNCRAEAQRSACRSCLAGKRSGDGRFARDGIQFRRTAARWKAYRRDSAGRDRDSVGSGTRKMTKRISKVVVLLVTLCAVRAIDAQSMFRGDATHSGTYMGPAPRQFHRVRWKFPTGDRVISSPVFKDNVIYFGGDDGNVYAVDATTGRQIWKRATNGPAPATPAIADGTVYIGSYDGRFYAFNAQTGALKWKFATNGERRFEAKGLHGMQPKQQTIAEPFDTFLSSPVVANGTVYFGSGDGNLYALDSATGDLRWKFKTGDFVHASPALADGVLFFGSWDSYFYAVDAAT